MIVVAGASGPLGGQVLDALVGDGQQVRALTHTAANVPTLRNRGAEAALVDLADADALAATLAGADALLANPPVVEDQEQLARNLVQAAAAAGVGRVVLVSGRGAGTSDAALSRGQARVEAALADGDVPHVIVRPAFWMQNLLGSAAAIAAGSLYAPAGDAPVAMVDVRDVADAAAALLKGLFADGAVHELTGPRALTHADAAAALSHAVGHPVAFVDVPADAAPQALRQAGLPGWQADLMADLFELNIKRDGGGVSDDLPRLLGRPARTFEQFAADHADAFTAAVA